MTALFGTFCLESLENDGGGLRGRAGTDEMSAADARGPCGAVHCILL